MSIESIITSLEKLIKLHKSLNQIEINKTEIVKSSDVDALNKLLAVEQNHVKAIELSEKERQAVVKSYLQSQGSREANSLAEVRKFATEKEAARIDSLKDELVDEMMQLKERNALNQQLIYQSLQFINISLDMFRPSRQNYNYDKPAQKQNQGGRSMFNSKA